MRTIRFLIALLWTAFAAEAANVTFNLSDILQTTQPLQKKTVVITPQSTPRTNATNTIVISEPRYFNLGTNASFTATNLVYGNYLISVWSLNSTSQFRILVPDTNTALYASDLIVTTNSVPSESAGYTQTAANRRFVLRNDGWASNLVVTNLVMPSGASDGYVWTASGSTGAGAWAPGGGGGGGGGLSTVRTNGTSISGAATSLNLVEGTNVIFRGTNSAGAVTVQINSEVGNTQVNAASNAAITTARADLLRYTTNIHTLPSIYTNVVYVNPTGATAVINGQLLTNAILSAPRLTKVHVAFGSYIIQTNLASLLRDQVHLYVEPGTPIDVGMPADAEGFRHLFHDFSGAITSSITGGGIFTVSNDVESYVMLITNPLSKVRFQFQKARTANQYACIKQFGGELTLEATDGVYSDGYDAYINEDTARQSKLYIPWMPRMMGDTNAGDSSLEFAGPFASPGDCVVNIGYARGDLTIPDNAALNIESVDLARDCVIYAPGEGVGNGILRNAYVYGTSNRTAGLIQLPSNDGGFRTAGVFENCRFIGATNRPIAIVSNSPTSSITFIDCRFEDGFGATNSIRAGNAQTVKLSNVKMDLGLHANVTQAAVTNHHGSIRAQNITTTGSITSGGAITATGLVTAIIGIDNASDYNQAAGNFTINSGVVMDIQSQAFFSGGLNLFSFPSGLIATDPQSDLTNITLSSDFTFSGLTLSLGNTPTVQDLIATNTITASNIYAANFIQTNGSPRTALYDFGGTNLQWRLVKLGVLTNVLDVSAAAFYPSNGTFFTVHNNNNGRITEWTLDGWFVRSMDWTAGQMPDAEAIVYLGGNSFAEVDEDSNRIYIFGITNNASGSTLTTNNTTIIQLPASIAVDGASSGVEGIAWDWDRNGWWVAHEKLPAQLLFVNQDSGGNWVTNNWFTTAQMQSFTNANQTDFSDLYLDRENQILWVAQDEGGAGQFDRILGISLLTSNILARISCTNFGQLEGVSVTPDGRVLAAGEANQFAIFEPVLGGLNSGISWPVNPNTNQPSAPFFPFGATANSNTVLGNSLHSALFATNSQTINGSVSNLVTTNMQFRAGASTTNARPVGLWMFNNTATINPTSNGTPAVTLSNNVPAHMLTNNGQAIRVTWAGRMPAALENTNQFQIVYGSETILDTGLQTASNTTYKAEVIIRRTGNTAQAVEASFMWGPGGGVPFAFTNFVGALAQTNGIDTGLYLRSTSLRTGGHTNTSNAAYIEP